MKPVVNCPFCYRLEDSPYEYQAGGVPSLEEDDLVSCPLFGAPCPGGEGMQRKCFEE